MPSVHPLSPFPTSPRRGFTLVELMVTLAVMVVVASVAVPSMVDFTANNQVVAAKSQFATAVALARTEAAKRGRTVFVQAIGTGSAGNEFANGWEVVVDDDGSGTADVGDSRVRRNATPLQNVRLGGSAQLAFRATGALIGTSAQVYSVCRTSGSSAGYSITVTPSGVADVAAIHSCS